MESAARGGNVAMKEGLESGDVASFFGLGKKKKEVDEKEEDGAEGERKGEDEEKK